MRSLFSFALPRAGKSRRCAFAVPAGTLSASQHPGRLWDVGILAKKGRSVATHCVFGGAAAKAPAEGAEPEEKHTRLGEKHTKLGEKHTKLGEKHTKPGEKHTKLAEQHTKPGARSNNLDAEAPRLDAGGSNPGGEGSNLDLEGSHVGAEGSKLPEKVPNLDEKVINLDDLPEPLRARLAALGRHAAANDLKAAVFALCRYQPMGRPELAHLLARGEAYVARKALRPLVEAGRLRLLHPQVPNHPAQKYVAVAAIPDQGKGGEGDE